MKKKYINMHIKDDIQRNTGVEEVTLPTIIAVDFDGTLCDGCWPDIGEPNLKLIGELIYRRSLGNKLILWSCRAGEQLKQAVEWCNSYGLIFDAVNDNIPEIVEKYGSNSRKITADIYIDDKSEKPWYSLLKVAV